MALTAKWAIQERCKDCQDTTINKVCSHEDCQLYGLNKSKSGCNRTKAIIDYCRWCLNGMNISTCCSKNCSIYQYRHQKDVHEVS
jgi:hypothetical protein